jgi:hypothetical protein
MTDTVTCQGHPTAEQLEASAKRKRESTAIWQGMAHGDDH